jgi:hypothetical protein
MAQVFAAINHRLSEEYAQVELPNEEVKERRVEKESFCTDRRLMM